MEGEKGGGRERGGQEFKEQLVQRQQQRGREECCERSADEYGHAGPPECGVTSGEGVHCTHVSKCSALCSGRRMTIQQQITYPIAKLYEFSDPLYIVLRTYPPMLSIMEIPYIPTPLLLLSCSYLPPFQEHGKHIE